MNCSINIDCMEYMRDLPDNAFDLAVVDPPYGDGIWGATRNASADGLTNINRVRFENMAERGANVTTTQKRSRGTWHRRLNTLGNYSGYRGTKLFGAEITSAFLHAGVFLYGAN